MNTGRLHKIEPSFFIFCIAKKLISMYNIKEKKKNKAFDYSAA